MSGETDSEEASNPSPSEKEKKKHKNFMFHTDMNWR